MCDGGLDVMMINICQIYGSQISTTEVSDLACLILAHVNHGIKDKNQESANPSLPVIEFSVNRAYQKFNNYWSVSHFVSAKIG